MREEPRIPRRGEPEIKRLAGKVMWVGRATVFLTGLSVILAIAFGVATTALAGTGVGAPFNLGQTNTVNKLSSLVGSVGSGANLRIDNNSKNASATALSLQVEPGRAPLRVNSSTRVNRLNADMLDGKDSTSFVQGSGKVYVGRVVVPTSNPFPDDVVISVPGFARVEALNCQSSGANVALTDFDQSRGTFTMWRDTGAADPDYFSSPGALSWNSNFQVTERTTWHLSVGTGSSAEAATIDVYTRVDGGNCVYSATAQVWGP
ncbi:hypothetical protein Rxycam_02008 [Rubrobacter xylanophilus DSM 9941]|uniref:hypothetical protein n=1 Tax=Rubrobacter xylanophilus TaxID=49319 RepID=UPI001C640083|nr:hypothetical protein [Rubrobacter xylanophilus]QYJ16177.1 hypothetical protein Rxycam_02008 [Rubrobacter xylanophilus DSM 9941]